MIGTIVTFQNALKKAHVTLYRHDLTQSPQRAIELDAMQYGLTVLDIAVAHDERIL